MRLVVPGWYGVWWVKWPRTIETSSHEEYDGFWQHHRYTFQTLEGGQLGVVRDHLPRSIVVSPADRGIVSKGTVKVAGLAWAGEHKVVKVEVSTNQGRTWKPAELGETKDRWTWLPWTATVEFTGPTGLHRIAARTTDDAGRMQEWDSRENKFGYGNNKIVSVSVDVVV